MATTNLDQLFRDLVREEVTRQLTPLKRAPADPDALLTSTEMATLLGTNRRAVQERFRRARQLGERHPLDILALDLEIGRRWRRSDVLAFIAAHEAAR